MVSLDRLTMAHRCFPRLLLVLVALTTLCQGSKIVFTSTPTSVSDGLTKLLTLRCALQDDTNSTNTVSRLSTITIRKAEGAQQKEVAKVVSGQAAVAGAVAAGASVSSNISNTVGYLQVSWSNPGQPQAGAYNCEIVALEADGTNVKLKSIVEVQSTSQSLGDLTRLISKANDDIEALENKVSLLRPPHAEEGTVDCGSSTTWGANLQPREAVREVLFKVPYERVPQVVIAIAAFDDASHTRINIAIRDLTTTGFKIVCATWWDSYIYGVWVRWTSSVA
ncbi:unnamed protein product [Candidula unifasciata]|uniref:H-type lectin domain-containing protein n=1 Tax=Candidula unifasciata TaxID=100452 RepID=A0A8S3ZUU9_9EUPU|nr:unnamed protein product [Candidula unifasciata]